MGEAATHFEAIPQLSALPVQSDLVRRAIENPIDIRPLIPPEEQRALMRREDDRTIPGHLATMIVLRCAGADGSVMDYDAAVAARRHAAHLATLKSKLGPERAAANEAAETTAKKAADYIGVHAVVEPIASRYILDYDQLHGEDRVQLETDIYNPTKEVHHPLLDEIVKYRKGLIRDAAIRAERVLRLLIIDRLLIKE